MTLVTFLISFTFFYFSQANIILKVFISNLVGNALQFQKKKNFNNLYVIIKFRVFNLV